MKLKKAPLRHSLIFDLIIFAVFFIGALIWFPDYKLFPVIAGGIIIIGDIIEHFLRPRYLPGEVYFVNKDTLRENTQVLIRTFGGLNNVSVLRVYHQNETLHLPFFLYANNFYDCSPEPGKSYIAKMHIIQSNPTEIGTREIRLCLINT